MARLFSVKNANGLKNMKKLFISYCHKDEEFRISLGEHLAGLLRKQAITIWHDRKLTAGEDWRNKIDENLEAADLVIFLITPAFLASEYCNDVEVKRALERHDAGSALFISIIVRPCDWKDTEFARFQPLPSEGKPISIWDNQDEAWLSAVEGIKASLQAFSPVVQALRPRSKDAPKRISDQCATWLEDTEIKLVHRKVDKVCLSDIYVLPDIEIDKDYRDNELEPDFSSAQTLYLNPGRYLLMGEEQQGKTSFLKKAFSDLALKSHLPIYVDVADLTSSDVKKLIQKSVEAQYTGFTIEEFLASENIVLLLDNLDEIGLNEKYQSVFIDRINELFECVIAT